MDFAGREEELKLVDVRGYGWGIFGGEDEVFEGNQEKQKQFV